MSTGVEFFARVVILEMKGDFFQKKRTIPTLTHHMTVKGLAIKRAWLGQRVYFTKICFDLHRVNKKEHIKRH